MRLLVFSDNHRDKDAVRLMIAQNPGLIHMISLGDSEMREKDLTEMNIYGVKGNYPFEPKFPTELTLEFEGVRVYFTHGHLYGVKMGLSRLLNHALYNEIQMVCFGHTHRAMVRDIQGVIFVNPGSLSRTKLFAKASYALIDIEPKSIQVVIQTLDGDVLETYQKKR